MSRQNIAQFIQKWSLRGDEKSDTQTFWLELLHDVLGIESPGNRIEFEKRVSLANTSFIDAYIPETKVLIEQKSIEKDLLKPSRQSDGSELTPFEQAKRYANELAYSERPRWIIVCNFEQFHIYDLDKPKSEPEEILLRDLEKEYYRLQFLIAEKDETNELLKRELEISVRAGELVGLIYDAFLEQYGNEPSASDLHSLNVLCVRLVFCLYAEDAGIFEKNQFYNYMAHYEPGQMRRALIDLFNVLNTPECERDRFLDESLAKFPYANGALFEIKQNEAIPQFNDKIAAVLLQKASLGFDWSGISPTIFGAVFESTLNPDTRRKGGMHYTSIENIHKVIDPLFLDELKSEFEHIQALKRDRNKKIEEFQNKLASLTFLDPASGCGNFLTETYLSLRRLENEAISLRLKGQKLLGFEEINPIKVSINQFYGIEINDFAVAVAKAALWIAENQMMKETERIIKFELDYLPLKSYSNIVEGNALRMDWGTLSHSEKLEALYTEKLNVYQSDTLFELPHEVRENIANYGDIKKELNVVAQKDEFKKLPETSAPKSVVYDYIMGNPPFVGARWMDKRQKEDVELTFSKTWKGLGDLDYVCCWYKKANDYIQNTETRCAFVSTNSITQGGAVANLWKPLFADGVHIDFAYRTFKWASESLDMAHVHCVIVGFSVSENNKPKIIFDENGNGKPAENINGYLLDMPNVFIESRGKPICDVPGIGIGNKPIDGGFYLFAEPEMKAFIKKEPASAKYFHPWIGSDEFIKGNKRWCLWLGDVSPAELFKMPECLKRVQAVREYRLRSTSAPTRKLADKPTRFHVENFPKGNYIVIPEVSSEKRKYIPIGFLTPDIFCSNLVKIIPDATLYHFGILTSSVHNAWMRLVCGRLKSDYRYSKDIVYNNFSWPIPTDEQKTEIEKSAQAILDARAKYADCTMAQLYGENAYLFPELVRAHEANDRAVMQAYGFDPKMTESDIVAELFKMYEGVVKGKNNL